MRFKIICNDKEFEHEVSVKNITYFGKPGKISELYIQIEQLLSLDRKLFEYHIDYFQEKIYIENTHANFMSHLRENRLSNLLDIELV
jgi:Uri superfamily endonuclease